MVWFLRRYLAKCSTASTTLVPSLALVSQNKAPYPWKKRAHRICSVTPNHGNQPEAACMNECHWVALGDAAPGKPTLASFSPWAVLTQPAGRSSRRSTLLPMMHIGICPSVESCMDTPPVIRVPSLPPPL